MRKALRERRGAVLVLVALLLIPLIGATGIAVDFAMIYSFKAQLQTTADAAAMAGVVDISRGSPGTAQATAQSYVPRNLVNGQTANVPAGNIVPGRWNPSTNPPFTPLGSWTDPNLNAIRVTATYPANYTFARIFGAQGVQLTAVAEAAVGSLGTSQCVTPWVVPYQTLLWSIGRPHSTQQDLAYNLTPADIAVLRTNSMANNIKFKVNASGAQAVAVVTGTTLPGNYYAVAFPPIEYANNPSSYDAKRPQGGANNYRDAILGCTSGAVGVGDWLATETGNMVGPTNQSVATRCGGTSGSGGTCNTPTHMVVPIYANFRGASGSNVEFQIKYLGSFVVTGVKSGEVFGYFDSFTTVGGFSPQPGPVTKAIMIR